MTDAMSGLATGAKGNKREQDILSPQNVVDFVRDVFESEIKLDPCASRDERSVVNARFRYHGPGHCDGLGEMWMDYTYVNPPFRDLEEWLAKAVHEASMTFGPIAMLAPTRPNRVWWHTARRACSLAIDLGAVFFIGYVDSKGRKASFPAPLSLLFWNVERSDEKLLAFAAKGKLKLVNIDRPLAMQKAIQRAA